MSNKCVWEFNVNGLWHNDCEYSNDFDHYEVSNLFKFCPYCGKEIEVKG